MLMLVYRVDADAAFELLKWRSQEANVKLRILAEQLLADFAAADLRGDAAPAGDLRPPAAYRPSTGRRGGTRLLT